MLFTNLATTCLLIESCYYTVAHMSDKAYSSAAFLLSQAGRDWTCSGIRLPIEKKIRRMYKLY